MIKNDKQYWRSIDQLENSAEFQDFLHREFPESASVWGGTLSRRRFLTLMGASMALAGLTACRKPVEKIIPYVMPPEEIIPGIPLHYASTMPLGTNAYGIVVKSHEGRPIKIEGNEHHPSTRGATNTILQASILGLYDLGSIQKYHVSRYRETVGRFPERLASTLSHVFREQRKGAGNIIRIVFFSDYGKVG